MPSLFCECSTGFLHFDTERYIETRFLLQYFQDCDDFPSQDFAPHQWAGVESRGARFLLLSLCRLFMGMKFRIQITPHPKDVGQDGRKGVRCESPMQVYSIC